MFNVEQCDGLKLPEMLPGAEPNDLEIDEASEALVKGWEGKPQLELTSATEHRAYYRPATDSVHMPARFRFADKSLYYATLFHELVHSTGHESRLNRIFGASFGDDLYSKEELVAETGAAFLCVIAGIATENATSNTAYIQNWIQRLEGDNRLIVHAAAAAQKAVDMITGHMPNRQKSSRLSRLAHLAGAYRAAPSHGPALVLRSGDLGPSLFAENPLMTTALVSDVISVAPQFCEWISTLSAHRKRIQHVPLLNPWQPR